MNLKEKFELVENVVNLRKVRDLKELELLFIGDRPKSLQMKEIIDETFFKIKKILKNSTKSNVELVFECLPFDEIDELKKISEKIVSLLSQCEKLFILNDVKYLVEINLSYIPELYISGECVGEAREIIELQEILSSSKKIKMTPKYFGNNRKWKNFVIKCELITENKEDLSSNKSIKRNMDVYYE